MLFDPQLLIQVQEFIQVEVVGKSRYYDVNEFFPERSPKISEFLAYW